MKLQKSRKASSTYAAIIACIAFSVSTAHAGNWYLGLGLGNSSLDGADDVLFGTSFDDSDTGIKLSGGFKFNQYIAVDLTYANLGTFTGTGRIGPTAITDDWEATAFSVSGVGSIPIGERFSLFGKLGFSSWRVEDSITVGSQSDPDPAEATGVDVSYGFGAAVNFTERFGMTAEYALFTGLGDDVTNFEEGADVSLLSINAVFTF